MARSATRYVCQSCGAVHPRWTGRCADCNAWNSILEETAERSLPAPRRRGPKLQMHGLDGETPPAPRRMTGIAELDRVTGGGLVEGSAILIGGDPGIGKSTLLLQAMAALSRTLNCAYVSGEEAVDQIRHRARRLGVADAPLRLASATDLRAILAEMQDAEGPAVIAVDSIQTMYDDTLDAAPGTVGQVRACAQALVRAAKKQGVVVLIVGHVTKDGAIAGPRVMEHMVDAVLYFEGERGHPFRILRGVKNRFGATSEIGVFDMTERGLMEVPNPSELFLSGRRDGVSGAVVFAGMEGTRPVLLEIQALVAPSSLGTPRRATVGWDAARLAMLLAVLETRAGYGFAGKDVYLNVAGGLRIAEPAADLAVAAALVSSLLDAPVPAGLVTFGEIGLGGEVRAVGRTDARLKEAAKLGFLKALIPPRRHGSAETSGLESVEISDLSGLDRLFGGR